VGSWYGESGTVLFSGINDGKASLWELNLSFRYLRATGPAKQLTSGDTIEVTPSLTEDGTLAYGHMVGALHIWRIDRALSSDPVFAYRVTDGSYLDHLPYISQNRRWLIYSRGSPEHRHIEIRDLSSGKVSMFGASSLDQFSPLIDDS